MADEATLAADAAAATQGTGGTEPAGDDTARTFVKFPTDKLRDMNRELRELRGKVRGEATTTRTGEQLPAEQQKALDQIGESVGRNVRSQVSDDLLAMRDELDSAALEREVRGLEADPATRAYLPDFMDSLRDRIKANPTSRVSDLVEDAKRDAVYRAFQSGKLGEAVADEQRERVVEKARASSPAQGAQSTGRGQRETSIDDMTPEQLAANPEMLEQAFTKAFGRPSRR